jgi:hypothetical protein
MNTGIQDARNLGWKLALMARGLADERLLDSYDAERRPVGRFVVRFTDRAFSAATSTNPLVRTLRTRLVPLVLPLALRFDRGVAYGFRTVAQLGIGYRRSPAVQEGRPAPRQGPRAGTGSPTPASPGTGSPAGWVRRWPRPRFHLLTCGPVGRWDAGRLAALGRLGVREVAHYLIRPDGHVGYRAAGTDLDGLERHLTRWLSGTADGG